MEMKFFVRFLVLAALLSLGQTTLCQRSYVVQANKQWQSTGVDVSEGDVVLIICRGVYAVSDQTDSESWMTPDGNADQTGGSPASDFLVPGASKHSVVCRIGSDGIGFGVGHYRRFTSSYTGTIYLAVNDQMPSGYVDNYGYAVATILVNCLNNGYTSGIGNTPLEFARQPQLEQNFPNPFNPSTAFEFTLPASAVVQVRILGENGKIIRTLFEGFDEAGSHKVFWDGKTSGGIDVSPGAYFYQLVVNDQIRTKKMLLIK